MLENEKRGFEREHIFPVISSKGGGREKRTEKLRFFNPEKRGSWKNILSGAKSSFPAAP